MPKESLPAASRGTKRRACFSGIAIWEGYSLSTALSVQTPIARNLR